MLPASVCRCEDCFLDMTAIILNNLKPRYRRLFRHMHKDLEMVKKINDEIHQVLHHAIETVSKRPHR